MSDNFVTRARSSLAPLRVCTLRSPKKMYLEFNWRDYKRFGPDGSTSLLSKWVTERVAGDYGSGIEIFCVTGNCRSLTGSNENLKPIFERFETFLGELRSIPSIKYDRKKKELKIDYATVWPTAEEFLPDNQMMKVGTFKRAYAKLITLTEKAEEKLAGRVDFEFQKFLTDLRSLESELPKTLDQMIDIYNTCHRK